MSTAPRKPCLLAVMLALGAIVGVGLSMVTPEYADGGQRYHLLVGICVLLGTGLGLIVYLYLTRILRV